MTKVKVKGAFLSKPIERARPTSEDEDDDNDDARDDLDAEFSGRSSYMPFVRADNKRKRGPRGMGRCTHGESSGLHGDGYSDSSLGTSSSRGSDDDADIADSAQNQAEGHGASDSGHASRRGSVRIKVTPSKFRENPSKIHNMSEGQSPLKKKSAGTPYERTMNARGYMYAERQQGNLTEELRTALMVVRKIMKMEAAEPFNVPVDPVALGIPDYFDIVKRPMDLGTICKNLERGGKYGSSRDVYEDVQLVWANCRIYNQKGDHILELLARVKKNFMKYWTAAGLYTEKSPATYKFQGRSPDLTPAEFEDPRRDMHDHVHIVKNKGTKFVKGGESVSYQLSKHSGSHEQGMLENKAGKLYPNEFGLHREQEVASLVMNDDLDTYSLNRDGPKIISVYKTHKKKKLEQDNEHIVQAGPLKGFEQDGGSRGIIAVKQSNTDKSHRQKDADAYAVPGKSRRVSGTGHHKADCSCVVCTGVRRKLAREGKLEGEFPAAQSAAQERILVRLKTEVTGNFPKSQGSGVKPGQFSKEHGEFQMSKELTGERANRDENIMSLKKVKVDEEDVISMDSEREGGAGRDGVVKMETSSQEKSEEPIPDRNKENSEGEMKLAAEEIEDKEDVFQSEENFADLLDAETECQEGGGHFYRASYEMPLRKMNPSILQMGERLFGKGSSWNYGRSLGSRQKSMGSLENPILSTASLLLSTKGT